MSRNTFQHLQSHRTLISSSFVVCLYLPAEHRDCSVSFAVGVYIAFLLVSVVPLFTDAIAPARHEDRIWTMAFFFGVHSLLLSWVVTGFNVATIYCQVRQTLSRPRVQALSPVGLAAQAAGFALMAISWIGRVKFPYEGLDGHFWGSLSSWYELVGWAAIDNGIFALGQAILLWVVWHHETWGNGARDEETEPLLRA